MKMIFERTLNYLAEVPEEPIGDRMKVSSVVKLLCSASVKECSEREVKATRKIVEKAGLSDLFIHKTKVRGSLVLEAASSLNKESLLAIAKLPPYSGMTNEDLAACKLKIALGMHNVTWCSCCGTPMWVRKPIHQNRAYNCSMKCKVESPAVRAKTEATNIERYGVANVRSSTVIKDRIRETNQSRFGHDSWAQSQVGRERMRETAKAAYNRPDVKKKRETTNIRRYGHKNPAESEIVREKTKATNRKRYGVDHYFQSAEYLESAPGIHFKNSGGRGLGPLSSVEAQGKYVKTSRERFGVDHPLQNKEVRARVVATNMKRYGSASPTGSAEVQEKIRATHLLRTGFEHPMHDPLEVAKRLKGRFEYTTCRLNGVSLKLQGSYEPAAARQIAASNPGLRFVRASKLGVWYEWNGRKHRYLPDFGVISKNGTAVVEVKSLWTLGASWCRSTSTLKKNQFDWWWKNLAKLHATAEAGYTAVLAVKFGSTFKFFQGPFTHDTLKDWVTRNLQAQDDLR